MKILHLSELEERAIRPAGPEQSQAVYELWQSAEELAQAAKDVLANADGARQKLQEALDIAEGKTKRRIRPSR